MVRFGVGASVIVRYLIITLEVLLILPVLAGFEVHGSGLGHSDSGRIFRVNTAYEYPVGL